MVLPKFDETMLPLLKEISDGKEYKLFDLSGKIMDKYFNLTEEEKQEKVSSGILRYYDRVSWGRTYLKNSGLVIIPKRGYVQITEKGKCLINKDIKEITVHYLKENYPSFIDFITLKKDKDLSSMEESSPQDLIDSGHNKLKADLKSKLLEKLKESNPYHFEKIILKLLKKMGYGEFEETPKSGDGGIDGIINQDALGIGKIYIQAKRFTTGNVREPEIRNFIGAMSRKVSKGIFVTTSDFDKKAEEKALDASHKIILINGNKLVDLMIKYNVGVEVKDVIEIKDVDEDFFLEE